MKTLFINKLAPTYKDHVLAKEPTSFNEAAQTARAMWKRRNPNREELASKHTDVNINPITEDMEESVKQLNLSEDIEEDVIMAIRNKRDFGKRHDRSSTSNSGNWRQHKQSSNKSYNKKDKKTTKSTKSNWPVTCWFCNTPRHNQIDCTSRTSQNKPLTWNTKEVKSKFHNNKIYSLLDFENMDEAREWQHKIEIEAKQAEKPKYEPDFQ